MNSWRTGIIAAMALPVAGVLAETPVTALLRDIDALRKVRETLQAERVEWETQREAMERSMALLQREKDVLESRIAEHERIVDEHTAEEVARERRRANQEQTLQQVGQWISAHAAVWDQARAAFPDRFETPPAEPTPTQQLQRFFGVAAAIQRLHNSITVEHRIMDLPAGGRRQMEALFIGRAQAYAVSPDDTLAAHGVWTGTEWKWAWNPDWAATIRTAVRVHQGALSPRWVMLPLTVPGESAP